MIIAECSTNWTDLNMAKEMIKSAKENGAGLAKFQLFDAEDDKGFAQYDWVKEHELTFNQAKMLFDYGESIDMEIFFSVFGVKYVDWCEKIGVKRYKIACDFEDMNVVNAIRQTSKEVIISVYKCGYWWRFNTVLFCIPEYPAKVHFDNDTFEIFNGFSDHTIGLDAAKIAFARGAKIIEKHFTLEYDRQFPDSLWSMTPRGLRELVKWEKICQEVL